MSSPSAPLGREEGERTQSISLLVYITEPGYYFTFPKMNRQLPAPPPQETLATERYTHLYRDTLQLHKDSAPPHTHTPGGSPPPQTAPHPPQRQLASGPDTTDGVGDHWKRCSYPWTGKEHQLEYEKLYFQSLTKLNFSGKIFRSVIGSQRLL